MYNVGIFKYNINRVGDNMEMFEKICIEMIKKCREYAEDENYTAMIEYLNKKEKQVERCRNLSKGEAKYVDALVKSLK